jgi:CRP/FNR family transcriptional regulator, cyclic AMP receptor protein
VVRLRRDSKVDLLKRVPLFSSCTKQEAQRLAAVADELDLPEGRTLTREGEPGREFFVLVDGTVDVVQHGEKIAELGAGDWLGEIALLTKGTRTATVTATTPVRVLVITDRAFRQVVEATPSIAVKVLERVGERLAHDAADPRHT